MGQSHHTLLHLELVQSGCSTDTQLNWKECVHHTAKYCLSSAESADRQWTTILLDDIIINKISSKVTDFLLVDKTIFISSSTVLTARLKTWTYNKVNMIINSSFWYSRIKEEGRSDFVLFSVYRLLFGNISSEFDLHFEFCVQNDDGDAAATACSLPPPLLFVSDKQRTPALVPALSPNLPS